MNESIILTQEQILHKTKRIAYQILEHNANEQEVILIGVSGNGYEFAKRIYKDIEKVSDIKLSLIEVFINKKDPKKEITTSVDSSFYQDKSIVLIDDVFNSGRTLIHGVKYFLEVNLNQFKIAVLVNRNHKKYPVKADYKGISVSTTLQEHIKVSFENGKTGAYLV